MPKRIEGPGLAFMDTPGFDPVSMTDSFAAGAMWVSSPPDAAVSGCKPMPCIKVATNTTMYDWMKEDMDLNAGTILDGTETVSEVGPEDFSEILEVAGGKRTKSELHGLGDEEFAPWILGADAVGTSAT